MAKKYKPRPPGTFSTTMKTSDKKELFLILLRARGGSINEACNGVGVSRRAYYNWIESDQEFKEAVQDVHEGLLDLAESKLVENIERGDNTAIIFFLKCKAKARGYIEKPRYQDNGLSAKSDVTLSANIDLSRLSIKELRFLRDISIRLQEEDEEPETSAL
jgi:hypothetical protein